MYPNPLTNALPAAVLPYPAVRAINGVVVNETSNAKSASPAAPEAPATPYTCESGKISYTGIMGCLTKCPNSLEYSEYGMAGCIKMGYVILI